MRFTYCPDCGRKLEERPIGDEGLVPYCEQCGRPWFDMFSSCSIVLVANRRGEVALLTQPYISTQYRNLVSGYIKPGETAEESARREVLEELGLSLDSLRIIGTRWFPKKELLMVMFLGRTSDEAFQLSPEVEAAEWTDPEEALSLVHPKAPGSTSHYLVEQWIKEKNQNEQK